ncbi:hypothetical protein PISMIDRAFT_679903 [Pisolithus microcarpus 441]|uniref:Unplaced genomic scaffold scaffold_52, whole genome shotgun sequence n=1 Tax=Pisolithus microcarpus 441 TaxID=765257 RepID=A0A0C9YCZ5_9AGAM|nr:hypothetical protein PISMIDRAFT_679903 [Pisolithus microcarpus 441]
MATPVTGCAGRPPFWIQCSHGRGISREAHKAMLRLLYGDRLADGRVYKAIVKELTQRREQASDCCRCKNEVRYLLMGQTTVWFSWPVGRR